MSSLYLAARAAFAVLAVAVCVGCASPADRARTAEGLLAGAGMQRLSLEASPFVLAGGLRAAQPGAALTVFVEGDGLAWLSRGEVSPDPTPTEPVALQLAARDGAANVAWLARPCQYAERHRSRVCGPDYWTDRRFAPEVVDAMNGAISQLVSRSGARGVHLVGFSGGGAVVALLAARRTDVLSLQTVGGNLDHAALHRHHGVSQLVGSLNAVDVAPHLAGLPQRHFVGGKDTVVPRRIADGFVAALGDRRCAEVVAVPSAGHLSGWEGWRQLNQAPPACREGSPTKAPLPPAAETR